MDDKIKEALNLLNQTEETAKTGQTDTDARLSEIEYALIELAEIISEVM